MLGEKKKIQTNSLLKTKNKLLSLYIGTCACSLMTFPVSEYSEQPICTGFYNTFWEFLGSECFSALKWFWQWNRTGLETPWPVYFCTREQNDTHFWPFTLKMKVKWWRSRQRQNQKECVGWGGSGIWALQTVVSTPQRESQGRVQLPWHSSVWITVGNFICLRLSWKLQTMAYSSRATLGEFIAIAND